MSEDSIPLEWRIIDQIITAIKDVEQLEERIADLREEQRAAAAHLQELPTSLAESAADKLGPSELRTIAWVLYWEQMDINVSSIASMLNVKTHDVASIVGQNHMPFTCNRCGQPIWVIFATRTQFLNWQIRKAKTELCLECQHKQIEEAEQLAEALAATKAARIKELKTMPYQEYLTTPEWDKRRRQHLKKAGYRCQVCNATGALSIHHRTYDDRGEERPQDLIALCRNCHEIFHKNGKLART